MASKIVKFMVPIYIKVDEAYDAETTLMGALGGMEDQSGGIYADCNDMTSRAIKKKDLPKEAKDRL